MKKFIAPLTILLIGISMAQAISKTISLVINGKPNTQKAIVINGKTYIPLEALKAGGASVSQSGSKLSLAFSAPATGGANQNAAVEGCKGEWLFNGIWRIRVEKVTEGIDDMGQTYWNLDIQIRNGSNFENISLAGTGWKGIRIIRKNGNSVDAVSDAIDLRDVALIQGASKTAQVRFQSFDNAPSAPDKLILLLDPQGLAGTAMKYSVKDPSFRINLNCSK